ncbi:MAG: hypothetical protein F6K62_14395 [Sphaerospermopsis sp. SIO1G2]|nr:hypothetical protein [Sphaerospermopsis sp. SIO1G2]
MREILDDLVKITKQLENNDYNSDYGNQSNDLNTSLKLVPLTSTSENLCLQKNWPKSKPIALICFPHLLHTSKGSIPTFWAMLPNAEIQRFKDKQHNNKFIGKSDVYPMLLWLTMLYDEGTNLIRWLSYYLDIHSNKEEKILRSLAGIGYYHLLLFTYESPHKCNHVITFVLTAKQRQYISDTINYSQKVNHNTSVNQAKALLKVEYDRFKAEVNGKLKLSFASSTSSPKALLRKLINFWKIQI